MVRIFCLLVLYLVIFPLQGFALDPSEKLLFEKNSPYQYISVVEDTVKKERYVRNLRREYTQGGIYVNAPDKLLFELTQMVFVSLAFLDMDPKDVLFIGLGAGVMPKYFALRYPDAIIDIAELDPDMVSVAEKYFFSGRTKG